MQSEWHHALKSKTESYAKLTDKPKAGIYSKASSQQQGTCGIAYHPPFYTVLKSLGCSCDPQNLFLQKNHRRLICKACAPGNLAPYGIFYSLPKSISSHLNIACCIGPGHNHSSLQRLHVILLYTMNQKFTISEILFWLDIYISLYIYISVHIQNTSCFKELRPIF